MYTAATIFPIVGQSTHVWCGRADLENKLFPQRDLHAHPAVAAKGTHCAWHVFLSPLGGFLEQKKKRAASSSSLAEGRLSGTWHDEIWHRVRPSHTVHISDRHFLVLLIWTLTPLELRYHSTSWQPEERLFSVLVSFFFFFRTYIQKNVYLNLGLKAWNHYLI